MCWLPIVALLLCAIPSMAQNREEINSTPAQALNQTDLVSTNKLETRAKNASSSARRIQKQNRADATLGTATSSYLDISQYASIDDAIWKTDNNEKFYKYTEEDDGTAWLSIPVYSAFDVVNSNYQEENCQRWIDYTGITNDEGNEIIYSLTLSDTWEASSPFAGGDYYFGDLSKRAYGLYTTDDTYYNTKQQTIVFYVTNCSAIQLLGYNFGGTVQGSGWNSRNYPAILNVYECTNNNGTLTASTSTTAAAQDYTQNTDFTLSVDGLDITKIYKVVAGVYCSMLYEIAFQTIPDSQSSAFGSYLDVARYKTIDLAGWNTSLVRDLYKYTEYPDNEVDWLTLPVYGAFVGARYSKTSTTIGSGHPQKWIECSLGNSNTYAGTTWTNSNPAYNNPELGWSAYFRTSSGNSNGRSRAIGYNSGTNNEARTVSFYVTNTTEVKLYGTGRNGSGDKPATLKIYECTDNGNGTVTVSNSLVKDLSSASTSTFTITAEDLDDSKIYKVEATVYRGYLYEIGFKTSKKKGVITADPTSLTFEAIVGETDSKTFHVSGTDLKNKPITATVTAGSEVYSINPNSITATDAENGGVDITVTFTPTTAGENITGSIKLHSDGAKNDVVVTLNGTAHARSLTADPTELTFKVTPEGNPNTQSKTFDVLGKYLKEEGVTLTLADENGVFNIDKASLTKAEAEDGATVTVTFSPTVYGDYTGTVTLSSYGVEDVIVYLTATSYPDGYDVKISQYGLTTLYVDFPLEIPYDTYDPDLLGVYYVKEATGTEVKLADVGDIIPANTGVIVQGNSGTYTFPRYKDGTVDPISNNLLRGSVTNISPAKALEEAQASSTSIVMTLGLGNRGYVGFYKFTGSTLRHHAAYLIYDKGAQSNVNSLAIGGIGGDFTGITDINTRFDEGAWYTLQGVRLNGKPALRGVYLHNGKAVVVR